MEAVKKYWFLGIFISILAIFAMSHNASAININFENYSLQQSNDRVSCTCTLSNNFSSSGSYCNFTLANNSNSEDFTLKAIKTNNTFDVKSGDIIEYYLSVFNSLNHSIDGGSFGLYNFSTNDNKLKTINVELVDNFNGFSLDGFVSPMPYNSGLEYMSDISAKSKIFKTYKISQLVIADGNIPIGLDSTQYSAGNLFHWYQITDREITFSIHDFRIYRYSESKENKEVEEKTQDAVDDSQAAGGSSSQDAQTGTTGLLNAITGAVNVISSASPTNCKINGNMGNLDMGQLDLCANPAPAFIQTIGSLILILVCVPLAISLFNRFIAIFRSFQS